jgi:poly-gamma-glutamate capsule biosynthesis protein CapA/YwtB (metallophosphatase superfamily)
MIRYILLAVFGISTGASFAQDTTRISLIFAGDVMGHDSQIASAYQTKEQRYDYTACFEDVKPYIESADLAIGNLEVTLAGPPYKGYPQFSSPDELAVALKDMGFDVLVTSNNHSVDRGRKGIERTIKVLDSLSIPHTGTFIDAKARTKETPLLIKKNGFSIAVLNYTYGTNGIKVPHPNIVNHLDTVQMKTDLWVTKAKKPDVIVVFTHWGEEYESLPRKEAKMLAEFCFKHGAKLVIGSHPHVIQPMEWRKDKDQFVAYSLGNFVSGQRKRYTDGGVLAYIELMKVSNAEKSITTISHAGYYLNWVYRTTDSRQEYYLLSSAKVELDENFKMDKSSREASALFFNDSRELMRKHNVNVEEMFLLPQSFSHDDE